MVISRAIKRRIRRLVAEEIRQRVASELPNYATTESQDLQRAWSEYVRTLADQIDPPRLYF